MPQYSCSECGAAFDTPIGRRSHRGECNSLIQKPASMPLNPPTVAVIVPFREQALCDQDRSAQLARFIPHMQQFFEGQRAVLFIARQSQDGRKFNRGQLLNSGFLAVQQMHPSLTTVVFHDVDLLPATDMVASYLQPPAEGTALHLASGWRKYAYPGFIGGVVSFRPADFRRFNGFPNNYWGWGCEDDQLRCRMMHFGMRSVAHEGGSFTDLDPINMLQRFYSQERKDMQHYNEHLLRPAGHKLDTDWATNGLDGMAELNMESTQCSSVDDISLYDYNFILT